MIIVKKDSEVMTNYVAANPVPAGEHFAVFNDIQQQPAVFSLGDNGVLNMIITANREPTRYDFAKQSNLFPKDVQVQAFAVQQAPDSSLDICIATKASDKESDFYLLHHITLDEITGTIPSAKLTHGLFRTIDHIYMGHKSTDNAQAMPLVMVAFQRADRLTSTEDLSYVRFAHGIATLVTPWSLPVNPKKIVDVTLITCSIGNGVMVLYEGFDSGKMYLVFKVLDSDDDDDIGDGFAVQVSCPAGATCLASYLDSSTAKTVVLVGGEVITALTSKNYISSHGGSGTAIDKTKNLKDLQLSQTGEDLRLWYTTSANAVCYYTTTTKTLTEGEVIPLLAQNQGGRISSLLSSRPREGASDILVSSLLSVDQSGNLSLLQQDPRSHAWQLYPYWHASSEDVTEVKGLMVRLHTTVMNEEDGDSSDLLPGSWLRVSCSGLVRCVVNGKHTTLSVTPQWYQTDAKGVLNILLQTEDATIHQFAVDAYRPAQPAAFARNGPHLKERNLTDPLLDPMDKMLPRLEGVETADDVRSMKKPDGSLMFPEISNENAEGAAAAFSQLVKSAKDVQEENKKRLKTYHAAIASPESHKTDADGLVPLGFFDDVGDWFNGAWHWIEQAAEDAWDWVCEKVGEVWRFVVKIGEEIWEITLDTITSIVKGIVWVFKKIGAFIQDIVEFLGYLFEWDDILDTTDSIAAGFNAALDYGEEKLASLDVDANKWLDEVKSNIISNLSALQENLYENSPDGKKTPAPRGGTKPPNRDAGTLTDNLSATVSYNWSTYNFTYGGGLTNAVLDDKGARVAKKSGTEDDIVKLWDDLQSELETIKDTVVKVASDLVDFFNLQNYSVQQVINQVGEDLVDGMIEALKKLVDIILQALKLGIDIVRDLANYKVDVPVLTWLWKNVIAGGRDLTLLNFCALLVAIPTTVLYKAKEDRAPPKLKERLTKDTFGQYVNGQDSSLSRDILGFSVAASSGVVLVGGEFDLLSLLVDGTFEGLGLEFIPIGPIDALMDVMDSASLTFNTLGGFTTWPVKANEDSKRSLVIGARDWVKYAGWGLSGAEFLAGAILNAVAKRKNISRPVKKRFKATLMAVMSVPSLCLSLTGNIMDQEAGYKQDWLIVNAYIASAAGFGASWGGAVARWNDEFENALMYIGMAVSQACTLTHYYLLVVDFVYDTLLN
ncbi:hypothetical protein BDW68DRAFT_193269 [Aspergillus falconensis]